MIFASGTRGMAASSAAWNTPARLTLGVVLLLLPLSSAVKPLLGLSDDALWIDPSLLLAPLLLLMIPRVRISLLTLLLLLAALLAMCHGAVLADLTLGGKQGLYDLVREPARLALCLMLFTGIAHFARNQPILLVQYLHFSVLLQMAFAAVVWLGSSRILTLPDPLGQYAVDLGNRQALWLESGAIARLSGSFPESPPFGLFMLSCLFVFYAARKLPGLRGLTRSGMVVAALGAALSLSDQIVIALGVFLTWVILGVLRQFLTRRSVKLLPLLIPLALLCAAGVFSAQRVLAKFSEVGKTGASIVATSGGERSFHTQYALGLLGEHPSAAVFGMGPGRYGAYAARTGLFPDTVTIQVTPLEWLVEDGALGLVAVTAFLYAVWKRARRTLGNMAFPVMLSLLLGILFQANWKWSGWFIALAFLYGLGRHVTDSKLPLKEVVE